MNDELALNNNYYSQNGEDYLLASLFQEDYTTGYFVEVGSLDGIRFSNSYHFERKGWSGVCVEPHPDYYPLLRKNRPGSHCIEVAAGNQEGFIDLFAEPRGDFSTIISKLAEDERLQKKMVGYRKINVPMLKLDQVLRNVSASRLIDFVSIDVEGAELLVLEGFDLSYFKPRVLMIEANDSASGALIDKHMRKHRYVKAGRLAANNFYCRAWIDAIRLALTPLACELTQPPHPLHPRVGEDDVCKKRQVDEGRLAVKRLKLLQKKLKRRILNRLG